MAEQPPGQDAADVVRPIMLAFAARTGLSPPSAAPTRYLWTDAHAVCTFVGLYQRDGDTRAAELARALIRQVHHVLGRHRDDDRRQGWLSGLDDADGAHHPTAGGLRIGKRLPERRRDQPPDAALEWDRDG